LTLFVDKLAAVADMREAMSMLPKSVIDTSTMTPDYLYRKLLSAEKAAAHRLRVFLEPTKVFAGEPTANELAAIPDGMPWAEEAGYDYEPELWNAEDWGYLVLRNRFVSAVDSVQFMYPAPAATVFTIPPNWIRLDKKAGHIRFVPAGTAMTSSVFSAFILSAMHGGRNVPQMIQVRYTAGLNDVAAVYPDLIDTMRKMAALLVIGDAFPAQSGSISADGLSQSTSVDISKWQEGVDSALDHIRDSLHGVRCMVL
jgi:hypothetical protein